MQPSALPGELVLSASVTRPRHDAPPGRSLPLDILRALAVVAVIGNHSPATPGEAGILQPIDAFIHRFGWTGVDLFFVLSGYLIGGLLFAEIRAHGRLDVRRFAVRRALRIWPAYYCFVAFFLVVLAVSPGVGPYRAFMAMWPAFLHIQNFVRIPCDHLWSLALEEHFYLALPLFLWLVTRNRRGATVIEAVPLAFVVLAIGCTALRVALYFGAHYEARTQTPLGLDALFAGVYLAYLKAYRPDALQAILRMRGTLLLSCVVLLPALAKSGVLHGVVAYSCVYVGYAFLMVHFVHVRAGEGVMGRWLTTRSARCLGFIGMHSYSIYLWHRYIGWLGYQGGHAVAKLLRLPGPMAWALGLLACVGTAIAAGILLDRLIEQPILRLRARLFPPRALVPAVAA
jgi:peptidoglycan/LPS O-acetylase OafA/YrhL